MISYSSVCFFHYECIRVYYGVLRGITGYYGVLRGITGYYGLLRGITGYYGLLRCITGAYLCCFTAFYCILKVLSVAAHSLVMQCVEHMPSLPAASRCPLCGDLVFMQFEQETRPWHQFAFWVLLLCRNPVNSAGTRLILPEPG